MYLDLEGKYGTPHLININKILYIRRNERGETTIVMDDSNVLVFPERFDEVRTMLSYATKILVFKESDEQTGEKPGPPVFGTMEKEI